MEEKIAMAKARIKELETLIKYWEQIKTPNASNRQGCEQSASHSV